MRQERQLSDVEERKILQAYIKRKRAQEQRMSRYEPSRRELEIAKQLKAKWFPKQANFFQSDARRRIGFCTRRAGKTIGCAFWLLSSLLVNPRSLHLYIAQTAGVAKLYLWPELKRLIEQYKLPFKINETDLTLQHERGLGIIILKGADSASEIEKLRGPKWLKVVLDEAASFGAHMENLITEVLGPALRDENGELIMIGTAGKVKAGIFYEAAHEKRKRASDGKPVYELHKWSLQDNPYLSEDAKNEDLIIDEDGFSGPNDPRFLREYRGIWVVGDNERVFAGFDERRNCFTGELPAGHNWQYIIGCDFGWHDESAMCVVAFSRTDPCIYVCDIFGAPRLYTDDIAAKLSEFSARYGTKRFVGDTGGYGKSVTMHLQRDYHINVEPAQKREKFDQLAFINSALMRSDLKVEQARCARLISQLQEVSWNSGRTDVGNHERDDLCLTGDALVTTDRGLVPIALVGEGDSVLTRQGMRPVANSGFAGISPVRELVFEDGTVIRATPDHRFFTVGGGEVCAADLKPGAELIGLKSYGGGAATGNATVLDSILLPFTMALDTICIGKNTYTLGDQFRRVTRSTTRITTTLTTARRTLSQSVKAIIDASTLAAAELSPNTSAPSPTPKFEPSLPSSDATSGRAGRGSRWRTRVAFATGLLKRAPAATRVFAKSVLESVTPSNAATAASTTSTSSVSSVATGLEPTNTADPDAAPSLVTRVLATNSALPGVAKTYRISVEDVHEYAANGLFQPNCFAMVYAWRAAKSSGAGMQSRVAKDSNPERTRLHKEKLDVLRGAAKKQSSEWAKICSGEQGSTAGDAHRGRAAKLRQSLGI